MRHAASGFLVALFLSFTLIGVGSAETKPPEYTEDLDAIVVTASKIPKPQKQVTQEVNIITEDAIDHFIDSKKNVVELLTFESGIFVNIETLAALQPDLVIIWSHQEESITISHDSGIPFDLQQYRLR